MTDRFESEFNERRRGERLEAGRQPGARPALTDSQPITCIELIAQAFQDLSILGSSESIDGPYAQDGLIRLRQTIEYINLSEDMIPNVTIQEFLLDGLGGPDIADSWVIPWGFNVYSKAELAALDPKPAGAVAGIQEAPPTAIRNLLIDSRRLTELTEEQFMEYLETGGGYRSDCFFLQMTSPTRRLWFPGGNPGGRMRASYRQGICLPLDDDVCLLGPDDPNAVQLDLPGVYKDLIRTELAYQLAAIYGDNVIPPPVKRMNKAAWMRIRGRNRRRRTRPSAWADIGSGNVGDRNYQMTEREFLLGPFARNY